MKHSKIKELLNALLKKYENSKLSKEGSSKNIRVFLNKNSEIFKTVYFSDAYKYFEETQEDLKPFFDDSIIIYREAFDHTPIELELNINKVDEVYKYLGKSNPKIELQSILSYLKSLTFDGFLQSFISNEINYIETKFTFRKSYYLNLEELKDIIKCLDGLTKLTETTKERDFSVKYLKDSKKFAVIRNKIISILKNFDNNLDLDAFDKDDDILENYNLVKNSTYVLIQNNLKFKLHDQIIDLNKLGYEFSFSDEMINEVELLDSQFKKVITVENLTSFYKLKEKENDAVIIYLAGFHNHTKKMLLTKIYEKFSNVEYFHFSDIDAGGFRIFIHLVKDTHIPFKPYHMGLEDLKNDNVNYKELTENDIKNLNLMLENEDYKLFHEQIKFMLNNNIKLEQENLD